MDNLRQIGLSELQESTRDKDISRAINALSEAIAAIPSNSEALEVIAKLVGAIPEMIKPPTPVDLTPIVKALEVKPVKEKPKEYVFAINRDSANRMISVVVKER